MRNWTISGIAYHSLGADWRNIMAGDQFVCAVHHDSPHKGLIAAAPDLYAAAEGALKALIGIDDIMHRAGMMQGVECPAIAPLRDALSKASAVRSGVDQL
jgi:hypothetical protein